MPVNRPANMEPVDLDKSAAPELDPARVPLLVDAGRPASAHRPITAGVPFPRGELTNPDALHLIDDYGGRGRCRPTPWPDGPMVA